MFKNILSLCKMFNPIINSYRSYYNKVTNISKKVAEHNIIGKKGEEVAKEHLVKNGYTVRDVNWRFRKNEVDIIADKNNVLVVVEVKTRTSEYFENPKEAVTKQKQKFIIKATEAYIEEFDVDMEVRFDIIGVCLLNDEIKIEHTIDAFQPSLL